MIDEMLVYSETLQKHSKEDRMFYLDLTTLRFTIDVIGKTILYVSSIRTVLSSLEYADRKSRNAHLGAQRGYNALADCMLSQIRWHQANAETNPFEYFNLVRTAVHWWNGRQMDQYIDNELSKRLSESQADHEGKRQKAIIDLILQGYIAESQSLNPKSGFPVDKLDLSFRAFATSQIRLFVFAGHDSVSSTICYILHLLRTTPGTLLRIRHEHDQVFGLEPSALVSLLKAKPHLVNNLPYTTAVVKEALRLFPPGGCSRAGQPNVTLTSDSGKECPSANVAAVFTIHSEMQRSPVYWIRPDEFLPDRWLVKPEHELYPVKGAYRPFEIGPRNCVAQALAMTELKVVLACLVRQFNFSPAYDEFDNRNPSKYRRTYRGERAYQIEEGAAHPADHYPCRVRIRKLV